MTRLVPCARLALSLILLLLLAPCASAVPAHRYWRIRATSALPKNKWWMVWEVWCYSLPPNGDGSTTLCNNPANADASTQDASGSWAAGDAFDGAISGLSTDYWSPTVSGADTLGQWLSYDFIVPTVLDMLTVYHDPCGQCPFPATFAVEGSDDHVSWATEWTADASLGFTPDTWEAPPPPDPTCSDGLLNGDEQGVDCGGSCAPALCSSCSDGLQNGDEAGVDCGGSCAPETGECPSCSDGIQNGDEEGVDCGGSCLPVSGECPSCSDGLQNGDEAGVDCGGSCLPVSGECPSCSDGVQNGDEAGTDCGGSCVPVSGECPSCSDGVQNQGEARVDCGGPCPACPPTCSDGELNGDEVGVDCGGSCVAETGECPSCSDGVQNQGETGVDCGGGEASGCPDCGTCSDGVQNGGELGVDCGGPSCPVCQQATPAPTTAPAEPARARGPLWGYRERLGTGFTGFSGWQDTGAGYSAQPANLFVASGGSLCTSSGLVGIHSHAAGFSSNAVNRTQFELSGEARRAQSSQQVLGVTVASQDSRRYYALWAEAGAGWRLDRFDAGAREPALDARAMASRLAPPPALLAPDAWHAWRLQVVHFGDGTLVKAKVWDAQSGFEPKGWHLQLFDASPERLAWGQAGVTASGCSQGGCCFRGVTARACAFLETSPGVLRPFDDRERPWDEENAREAGDDPRDMVWRFCPEEPEALGADAQV